MITIDDFKANIKEWLIDKLADMSLKEASQTISDLYNELHKPKYPKTYEECFNVHTTHSTLCSLANKTNALYNLLICRNAYWKIAGEQMGLGKPWDSKYGCGKWGYWIEYDINENKIYCQDSRILFNRLLVFPTKEMRDIFYENFKDLIEQCKELL